MRKNINFEKHLKNLGRKASKDVTPEKTVIPEGEEYDIDSLMAEMSEMESHLDKTKSMIFGISEMHDSKLHREENEEGEDTSEKPEAQICDPMYSKNWEKGNVKIDEAMKIYNESKKHSFKEEKEKESFQRLIDYKIPKDKERIKESKMWGLPQNQDRLVVLIDKEEAVLLKKENFDFDKLSEKKMQKSSKIGHSLNVFDQLFETWYEYDSKDFEKIL